MQIVPVPFDPNTAENNPDIEKQWAVKAFDHADVYMKLLQSVDMSRLHLTKFDHEIYSAFRSTFPDFNVESLDIQALKSDEAKAQWRDWIKPFEKKVDDYNFGTLLRLNSNEGYTEHNSIFATRIQFYAIEIARNREGWNACWLKQQSQCKKEGR